MKCVNVLTDVSVTDIKVDLMRIVHDNEGALLNSFDPRVALMWTVLLMIIPWLFYDTLPLAILLATVFVLTALSQVSKYLLALLLFGQVTNVGLFVMLVPLIDEMMRAMGHLGDNASWAVEGITTGDMSVFAETRAIVAAAVGRGIHTAMTSQEVRTDAVGALAPFFLKLTAISVISLAIFSATDPQKLSEGMLCLGILRQLMFAIDYDYRMTLLPAKEYHALINPFRLRSKVSEKQGLSRWCYFSYLLTLSVKALYPLIFNATKHLRVNIETMETKGFSRSLGDEQSQTLRAEGVMVRARDVTLVFGLLLSATAVWVFT